mgnify:CR=1 FL=1
MNTEQIRKAVHMRFHSNEISKQWSVYDEFRWQIGYYTRTIDVMVFSTWESNVPIQAFEIKASRSDFFNDIKEFKKKQGRFVDISNMFWYVTPWGMVKPGEVPECAGLYWVNKSKKLIRKKQAQLREVETFPLSFIASLAKANSCFYDYNDNYLYLDEEKMSLEQASRKIEKFIKEKLRFEIRREVKNELQEKRDELLQEKSKFSKVINTSKAIKSAFEKVFHDKSLDFLNKEGYYHRLEEQVIDIFHSVKADENTKKILLDLKNVLDVATMNVNGLLEKNK